MPNPDFLTRPNTRTPRWFQTPAEYGAAVQRFERPHRHAPRWLDIALAVAIGATLGVLFAWRG